MGEVKKEEKKKYLWCRKCNAFPIAVVEMHDWASQKREWNEVAGDYTVVEGVKLGESILFCGVCESSLEEK